jgi:hypothetical protein
MSSSTLPSNDAPQPQRRRAVDMALAMLVLWAAGAMLFAAHGARHDWLGGHLHQPTSAYWRLGSKPTERLRRCVEMADQLLAPGEPLLLWDPDNDFYRWRWTAYFLPQRDVVHARAGTPAGSLVVASSRTAPPGARLERGERWCGLYRLP